MDAVSLKLEGGVATLEPRRSHETSAQCTVIFNLVKVRSWSATFLKAIETGCGGCGPKLAALLTNLVRLSGLGFLFASKLRQSGKLRDRGYSILNVRLQSARAAYEQIRIEISESARMHLEL